MEEFLGIAGEINQVGTTVGHGGKRNKAGNKKKKSGLSSSRKKPRPKRPEAEDDAPGAADAEAPAAKRRVDAQGRNRSQYFTFTYNFGKDVVIAAQRVVAFAALLTKSADAKEVGFYSCGHEIAPQTGEHHIQGYLETPKGVRWTFAQFHKAFSLPGVEAPPWVKASRGSAEQNITYTGKAVEEGRWYSMWGTFRNYGQGRSADMVAVQKELDGGSSIAKVYKEHFETSAKHFRFFK